jgi:hypothetical protein
VGNLSRSTALLLIVACGGSTEDGRRSDRPVMPAGEAFAGPGGAKPTAVCAPAPGNFDFPGNGCDDDADGRVDASDACDDALPVTGDAQAFVKALDLCKSATDSTWGLVSAKFTRGWNTQQPPDDGQHGILPRFGVNVKPRAGASLGVLSTGFAREFNNEAGNPAGMDGLFQGGRPMTEAGAVPPGYPRPAAGCEIATDVHDVISVELEIKAPTNARGISFDFNFYSGEWPQFVCTRFNDGFAAFLRAKGFGGGVLDNISFDANKNPVSVNNGFFDRCTPNTMTGCQGGPPKTAACPGGEDELAGTGFATRGMYCGTKESSGGGATGWLTSQAPIEPGETFKLDLVIWDTGDAKYDSSVLLDHFTWLQGPTVTKTERPK